MGTLGEVSSKPYYYSRRDGQRYVPTSLWPEPLNHQQAVGCYNHRLCAIRTITVAGIGYWFALQLRSYASQSWSGAAAPGSNHSLQTRAQGLQVAELESKLAATEQEAAAANAAQLAAQGAQMDELKTELDKTALKADEEDTSALGEYKAALKAAEEDKAAALKAAVACGPQYLPPDTGLGFPAEWLNFPHGYKLAAGSQVPPAGSLRGLDMLLWHTPQTGGAAVGQAVAERCRQKHWTLRVHESGVLTDSLHSKLFGTDRPLSAIHLRHPVARAESHIRKLMSLKANCVTIGCEQPLTTAAAMQVLRQGCRSFPADLPQTNLESWPTIVHGCIQDLYVKSLIGTPFHHSVDPDSIWTVLTEQDLEKAKARLANFDLVLITEWFDKNSTQLYLNSAFDLDVDWPLPSEPKRGTSYPPQLDETDLAQLREWNQFDLRLYAFALSLSLKRMRSAGFVGFDPSFKRTPVEYVAELSHAGKMKQLGHLDRTPDGCLCALRDVKASRSEFADSLGLDSGLDPLLCNGLILVGSSETRKIYG